MTIAQELLRAVRAKPGSTWPELAHYAGLNPNKGGWKRLPELAEKGLVKKRRKRAGTTHYEWHPDTPKERVEKAIEPIPKECARCQQVKMYPSGWIAMSVLVNREPQKGTVFPGTRSTVQAQICGDCAEIIARGFQPWLVKIGALRAEESVV